MEVSHLGLNISRFLGLCTLPGCEPLILFPSAAGKSFSNDDCMMCCSPGHVWQIELLPEIHASREKQSVLLSRAPTTSLES